MTSAASDIGEYYQMLQIQSSASDDGRKHRPKHVELIRNNKLTYIVASCWLFCNHITMHRFIHVMFGNETYLSTQRYDWCKLNLCHTRSVNNAQESAEGRKMEANERWTASFKRTF
jgi:hypothetical protein